MVSWNQTGPAGPAGANGKAILNGTSATPVGGNLGDFYLDTAHSVLWGPKHLAGWPSTGVALKGAAGTNGTNGHNGTSASITTADAGANCPTGGVEIDTTNGDAANSPVYVCNGAQGDTGDPGPGAVSVDAESSTQSFATLSGVGVQIGASCNNGNGSATFVISGDGPFSVSGTYITNGVVAVTPTSGVVSQLPASSVRDDNSQSGTFEIDAGTTAAVGAHLLVTSGGSVASVDVFLAGSTTTHCAVRGVGVPTG